MLLCVSFGVARAETDRFVESYVYKYVGKDGKVHFTDAPMKGHQYKLEWKRESRKLAREAQARSPRPSESKKTLAQSRSSAAAPQVSASLAKRRAAYESLISANAQRYGLPSALVHAVIRAESAYNPTAVSRAGAQGLMQLMPGTAARYGVSDSFDPAQNIRGGTAYLRDLLDLFDWNLELALAGYNAGEGAVIKHGHKIPPYAETQGYVRKVHEFLRAELGKRSSVAMTLR